MIVASVMNELPDFSTEAPGSQLSAATVLVARVGCVRTSWKRPLVEWPSRCFLSVIRDTGRGVAMINSTARFVLGIGLTLIVAVAAIAICDDRYDDVDA